MTARGLAGAALAVGAWVGVGIVPRPLASEPPPALAAAEPDPGPTGLVDTIDDQIHARAPELAPDDRRALARVIVAEAELAALDPLLVLAIIEVESSFDPAALSPAGARGLMQLREPTMRREVERAGLPPADPHDPVANVRAGVRYLRRLVQAFGREEVALMAYNAGPNRILGYLRAGEIPARFHVYPRRVESERRRLRRSLSGPPGPALARTAPAREPVALAE